MVRFLYDHGELVREETGRQRRDYLRGYDVIGAQMKMNGVTMSRMNERAPCSC